MELILIFTGSFVVALSGALAPGTLLAATIAYSVKRGAAAGPLIILGHMILELGLLVLLIFGLSRFIFTETVIRIIFISGGFLMIILGGLMLRSKNRNHDNIPDKTEHLPSPFLSGIVVSVSNPYWTIWWLTIGMGYLLKALQHGILGIAAFFLGHILADFGWYTLVSYSVSRGKNLAGGKKQTILIFICGVFLILFGIWFFISGIRAESIPKV